MRANELRELPPADLPVKLEETKEELFNLRFQNATGQLENFSQLQRAKREIARIETILRERDLGIEIDVPAPQAKPRRSKRESADDKNTGENE